MKLSSLQATLYIQKTAKAAWFEFQQIYNCGLLPEIVIQSHKTGTAGTAFRNGKKVTFNLRYAMSEGSAFDRTIYHELAHIIQFRLFPNASQAHGPEFRAIMESVGKDGSTYHSYSVRAAKSVSLAVTVDDL